MQAESFHDFDEFASSIRGVDSRMLLRNAAQHRWDIAAADVVGVRVQLGRLGSGNIVEGQSWADGTLIYLPLTDACEYSANGVTIGEDAFMILEPGCEFCVSTRFEHDWCSVFVPTDFFESHSDLPEDSSSPSVCRVTRPDPSLARQFRVAARDILRTASNHPDFESSLAARVASAGLVELGSVAVGRAQRRDPSAVGRPRVPRDEIIRRVQTLLEQREGERVSLQQLTEAAGVSERTLRTAFGERYGTSPLRYLQLRTLHHIHRALKRAEPDETLVKDVLLDHGEWEFGRVALRYRHLFGESPSQTLRGHNA